MSTDENPTGRALRLVREEWEAPLRARIAELEADLGQISAMLLPDEGPPVQGVHALVDELRLARSRAAEFEAEVAPLNRRPGPDDSR